MKVDGLFNDLEFAGFDDLSFFIPELVYLDPAVEFFQ